MSQSRDSSLFTDRDYLRREQYRDSSNLNARATLHQRFSVNRYGWHRWVFDHMELPPDGTVLELGCGTGELWRQNAYRIPKGWHLFLSDLSTGMIGTSRSACTEIPGSRRLLVGDAQSLPLGGGRFDAIVANHMLHHVPDVPNALREIRRALRSGGVLYASAVGQSNMRELHSIVSEFNLSLGDELSRPRLPFTIETGVGALAECFENVRIHRYPDALHITEAGPLVDYVGSGLLGGADFEAWSAKLQQTVSEMIAESGAIRISKDSGLFIAW